MARRTPKETQAPQAQTIEIQVDDRCREQRQHLADYQAANNRNAERPAQFGSITTAESQRQASQQSRHRGHHNRPEAQYAGLVDSLLGRLALVALCLQREIDHQYGVLLNDSYQQNNADYCDHAEIDSAEP